MSKLVWLGCVGAVSIAVIARYLSPLGALIALGCVLLLIFVVIAVVVVLIFKRPEAAAMEGMELVYYTGLQLGAKGIAPDRTALPIPDPTPPTEETRNPK